MIETNFSPFPVLITERLVLRQPGVTDAEDIFHHRSDDIVNIYLEDYRHASVAQTRAYIERVQKEISEGRTIFWVLTEKGRDRFIGAVCLWNISRELCKAEAGYTLAPEFHRKGYMHEALQQAISFGFNRMKLQYIDAYTHEQNEGSIRLLLRNKFIQGTPQKEVSSNRVYFLLKNEML